MPWYDVRLQCDVVYVWHGAYGVKGSREGGFEVLYTEEHLGLWIGISRLRAVFGNYGD